MSKTKDIVVKPVDKLKSVLSTQSVRDQFQNAMGENSGLFIASLIDVFGGDKALQKCDSGAVVLEALKAAVLKLPLNKNLGFAWLIAYKIKGNFTPNFQIGYKGYTQLALRTGFYKYINTGILCEGHTIDKDLLTGSCRITGEATSDKAIGYFAYIELLNGFQKSVFWTKDEVTAHAKRYSKSYNSSFSPWKSDFNQMASKTVLTDLLKKYGILSVEMASALGGSDIDQKSPDEIIQENANKTPLDINPEKQQKRVTVETENPEPEQQEMSDAEKEAIVAQEIAEADHSDDEPDFFNNMPKD